MMPIVRVVAVSIGFSLSMQFATASYARDIGALGGAGGSEFRSNCRPGDVIVGFEIQIGKALDAVRAQCVSLNPQRTEYASEIYALTNFGGHGGNQTALSCKTGYAVRHLHVYMDSSKIVNEFRITCQALNSGDWHDEAPLRLEGETGVSIGDVRFSCGDGEWATGIYGRYGSLIDQLGLQCEKLVVETPPSQAEPPILGGPGPGGKVIEKIPGDIGAAPPPPPPPPPPATPTCTVLLSVDVYSAPGGTGQQKGVLAAGTQGVTKLEGPNDNWYHVKWPAGDGWVYSGPDYTSLNCP